MGSKKQRNPEKRERKKEEKLTQTTLVCKEEKALYNEATIYLSKKEYGKAIETYLKIPPTSLLYTSILLNLGAAYAYNGNNEQAVECWDKILPGDEKYFTAQYSIGILFFRKKNYEKARYYWLKIPLTDSNYYNAQYFSGRSYDMEDIFHEAIQCYLKVDAKSNLYDEAQYYLGWDYALIQDYLKSLEFFMKVRKDHIMYKDTQNRIGSSYFCMLRLKEGLDAYIYWLQLCQENNDNTNREAIGVFNLFYDCFYEIPPLKQFPNELLTISKLTHTYFTDVFNIESRKNTKVLNEYLDENISASLYKYSSYDINIVHSIKNEEIYFSDPFNFNDPFDPLIRVMDAIKSKDMKQILNYRISCLSSKWHDILMWSHYANKHQGICIEYDINNLIKQSNIIFRKIDYIEKLPKPFDGIYFEPSFLTVGEKPVGFDDRRYEDEITLIDTFTRKQKTWEYEKEYRLLLRADNEEDFLQHCPIKAIYFGKDMEQKNKDFIASMVADMNIEKAEEDKIKLYNVSPSDKDIFSLERKEYS